MAVVDLDDEVFSLLEAKLLIAHALIQQFHEPDEAN
jgi:hypothetical protein